MADYIRGQTIHFLVAFLDANDAPFTPTAPKITINYPSGRARRGSEVINLSPFGSQWVANWDSSAAGRAGTTYWTVYSGAPEPKVANDGKFSLGANTSNLDAVA